MKTLKDEPVTVHDISTWADEAAQGLTLTGSASVDVSPPELGLGRSSLCAWTRLS